MNPIVNLNIALEKELELERQGLRRTRRWIGDANRVTDSRWYRTTVNQVLEPRRNPDKRSRMVETKPRQVAHRSILTHLLQLPNTSRLPARSKA